MAALAAFFCVCAWAVDTVAAERIVVGLALDLSGPGAIEGREARSAMLLEMARINRRGVAGGRIFLLTLDTKGSSEGTVVAVRELARKHKSVAVIGPRRSLRLHRRRKKAAQRKNGCRFSPCLRPRKFSFRLASGFFSTARPSSLPVRLMLGHMKDRGIKRAAMLGSSLGYGTEGREQITALAPDFGVSILLNESFKPGEHNFLPFLKRRLPARRRGLRALGARGVARGFGARPRGRSTSICRSISRMRHRGCSAPKAGTKRPRAWCSPPRG